MNNTGNQGSGLSNEQKHQEYVDNNTKAMKKSEKIFFAIVFVIAGVFIFFLPDMYKFISNFSIKDMFSSKPVVEEPNENNNQTNNENNNQEEKYKAVTCTKVETGEAPFINTTILYFSDSKLKKINLTETYAYKDGYEKTTLNTYYLPQQNKLANQKGFEMKIDSTDEQIYTVNYSLDMAKVTNDVLLELKTKLKLDSGEVATVNEFNNNGFLCE